MADNVIPINGPRRAPAASSASVSSFLQSWQLHLEEGEKSASTIRSYLDTARGFLAFLDDRGMPSDVEGVRSEHLRVYLAHEKERTSPGNAAKHHRNLGVLWSWLEAEGERRAPNPMRGVDKIKVAKKAEAFFEESELRALLATCSGASFEDRRDTAIMRIFMDIGVRVSGLAGLRYHPTDESASDVMLRRKLLRVGLQGGDEILAPVGRKALAALDRYLRVRARHTHADSPNLWLGVKGRGVHGMTKSGIAQMLTRRGEEAGVQKVHPHRFRRTWAHEYLKGGGAPDQAAAVAGWRSVQMVHEYAGDLATERAREAHVRLSPGDRV